MDREPGTATVAYRAVLLAGGLLVLGLLFEQLLTLLLAVLITVILAIVLASVADRLERRFAMPRPVGALVTLLAGLAAVAGVIALVIDPFIEQTNEFVDDVPGIVDELREQIHDVTGAQPGEIADRVQEFAEHYTDDPERLIGPITSIGLSVAGVLGALILILITAYYMPINPDPLLDGIRSLVPPPPPRPRRPDHGPPAHLLDRLDAGRGRGHGGVGSAALHRAHDHRPGLRDLLRRAHGAVLGRALLRRDRERAAARAVRAHRLPGKGAAGDPRLHRRSSSSRAT